MIFIYLLSKTEDLGTCDNEYGLFIKYYLWITDKSNASVVHKNKKSTHRKYRLSLDVRKSLSKMFVWIFVQNIG